MVVHTAQKLMFTNSRRLDTTTLNLTFSPLRDGQQEALGVAVVLDDVSEKKRLESVRRYLPPKLVDQIRDLDAAQRPQRRTLSVLFADLRGFSTYGEDMDPEQLIPDYQWLLHFDCTGDFTIPRA